MTNRKLATIQKISNTLPIEGRDKICLYHVNGWQVIDIIGKYEIGDLVIFLEIDSWVSNALAPFLSKGKEPREFEGIKGERLKTIRMGGVLSQGLLLPVNNGIGGFKFIKDTNGETVLVDEGADVTEQLGILKWEKPIPAQLRGQVRGNFPLEIPKTDTTRIQNLRDWEIISRTHTFEVTEKLHGSSCTFYLDMQGEFRVCSRNLDLKEDENNAYWKVARQLDIENKMRQFGFDGCAIQGELVGEGINGNQYGIKGLDFYVFNIYGSNVRQYFDADVRTKVIEEIGLKQVPKLDITISGDIQEMLKLAESKSLINGSEREGFVLKSQTDTSLIIKVISNKWLINGGDDQ